MMPIRKTHLSSLGLAAMLACTLPAIAQNLDRFQDPRDLIVQAEADLDALAEPAHDHHQQVDNRYRIGIACEAASPALRVHLRLQEDTGLVVKGVLNGSPGHDAGIRMHDVIVEANGHPVASTLDLVRAVNEAKGTEMSLTVIQAGEEKLKRLTPEERDEEEIMRLRNGFANRLGRGAFPPLAGLEGLDGRIQDELQRAMEQMEQQMGPLNGAFRRFNPGIMIDPRMGGQGFSKSSTTKSMTMSNGDELTINIEREGDKPAKITVKRGADDWQLTESDLGQLPDDIRPLVESQLNGAGMQAWTVPQGFGQPMRLPRPNLNPGGNEQKVQKRFDDLELKMQDLQDAIRSIQGSN